MNVQQERRLENRTAIVTGGGYGIGEAIARLFAREGALVVVAGRSLDLLETVASEIRSLGGRAEAVRADVGDEPSVERLVARAVELGGCLDVLVNNAGIAGPTRGVAEVALEEWEETLRTNLTGAFLCAKHAVRAMTSGAAADAGPGGAIVNIASVAGRIGYPMRTPYAASKWGMIGLNHSLAAELGEHGIRVNCVCPGPVAGERMDRVIAARAQATGRSLESVAKQTVAGVPLGRMVTADEVARVALHFACDESSGVTGQAITVCGGLRMQ